MSRTRRRTAHKTTSTSTDVTTQTRMVPFVETPVYLEFVQHLGDPATTLSTLDNLLDGLETMDLGHGDLETTEFPDIEEIAAKYPAPPVPTVQSIEDELFPPSSEDTLAATLVILAEYDDYEDVQPDGSDLSDDFATKIRGWLAEEDAQEGSMEDVAPALSMVDDSTQDTPLPSTEDFLSSETTMVMDPVSPQE